MKSNAFGASTTRTRIVVNCGLFIALSVVLKILFELYIPLGGLFTHLKTKYNGDTDYV